MIPCSQSYIIHGCSAFTEHNLQILYALRVAISLASESLFHDGRLALLYLQDASLDSVCNLTILVSIYNTECKADGSL